MYIYTAYNNIYYQMIVHIAMPFEKDGTKGYTQTNRQLGYVIVCIISSFSLKKKGGIEGGRGGEGEREDQTNKI